MQKLLENISGELYSKKSFIGQAHEYGNLDVSELLQLGDLINLEVTNLNKTVVSGLVSSFLHILFLLKINEVKISSKISPDNVFEYICILIKLLVSNQPINNLKVYEKELGLL